jgi:hypothetical protein
MLSFTGKNTLTFKMNTLLAFVDPSVVTRLSALLTVQSIALLGIAFVLIFLIFYTTKDIITRTSSFVFMLLSLLIVTALPVIGFMIYLLIRPTHTRMQRVAFAQIAALTAQKSTATPSTSSKVFTVKKSLVKKKTDSAKKPAKTVKKS